MFLIKDEAIVLSEAMLDNTGEHSQ